MKALVMASALTLAVFGGAGVGMHTAEAAGDVLYMPPQIDWRNYEPPSDGPRWESRSPEDNQHWYDDRENPAVDLPDPSDPKEGTIERQMDPVPDEAPDIGE
jgi:hypothetical protein